MSDPLPTGRTTAGWRHWAGFLVSGGSAFITDVTLSKLMHDGLGWPWPVSRFLAISLAMVVGWLAHRRLTFALATKPALSEFGRYASVAWAAAALNYVVFLLLIYLLPAIEPALAIAMSSGVAMAASYLGMRFAVFRR
jgi:putative flippase GtrA